MHQVCKLYLYSAYKPKHTSTVRQLIVTAKQRNAKRKSKEREVKMPSKRFPEQIR